MKIGVFFKEGEKAFNGQVSVIMKPVSVKMVAVIDETNSDLMDEFVRNQPKEDFSNPNMTIKWAVIDVPKKLSKHAAAEFVSDELESYGYPSDILEMAKRVIK